MKFNDIYNTLIVEASYYEPKYIGNTLEVKPKVPVKLALIAGKMLTFIDKPSNTKGVVEIVGASSHGETAYAKDETGVVYSLFNVPAALFTVAAKNGKKVKLGGKKTEVQESAVCHFLALALKSKMKKPEEIFDYIQSVSEDVLVKDLQACQDRYETSNVAAESASLVKNEKKWAKSISATCARLIGEFKFTPASVFHRGSTLSNSIDDKGLKLANEAGAKFGAKKDKWNPSDMWVIKRNAKAVTKILNAESLQELNGILNDNLETGKYKDLMGISLKQSGYPKAVLKYMNMDEGPKQITSDAIETGKTPTKGITKNTDILDTDDGLRMSLRSSAGNTPATISGIIAGKRAQHGSVTITDLFKHNKAAFPSLSKDPNYYYDGEIATKEFYSEFQKLINEVIANAKRINIKKLKGFIFTIKNKKQLDKFMTTTLASHNGRAKNAMATLYSKLQGLYLVSIMKKDTLRTAYITASAQGDFNPRFVKVGE